LSSLNGYVQRLKDIGAPITKHLLPGAPETAINQLEQDLGVTFPADLRDFWTVINGVGDGLTYHQACFAGFMFAPISLAEARHDHALWTEMRTTSFADDPDFAAAFWPEGYVKLLGEDAQGCWVDCNRTSQSLGAVFIRLSKSEPLELWSASVDQLFVTLTEALDQGLLYLADGNDPEWDPGSLATCEDELEQFVLAKLTQ